ncbi:MAG TPA: hypothetical protein V6D20_22270 [Candidatus Obscuribacterales bacterium]
MGWPFSDLKVERSPLLDGWSLDSSGAESRGHDESPMIAGG